ncbi:MAG: hypothetical protein J6O73_02135 [Lachnospiraceae bacterium]|nr:hypothetical protein [Lachnospiraceae bacterium]
MNLDKAYCVLERYLCYLMDCYSDGNYAKYDVDSQFTKNRLEEIVMNQPELSIEDRDFLRELLDDVEIGESVAEAIKYILSMED